MSEADNNEIQRQQAEQAALNNAAAQAPTASEKRQYMEAVLDDDIDDATVGMLANLFSQSHILANLQDAEVHELKKLREITLKKVFAAHPSKNTVMQGQLREEVYGEGAAALKPLSHSQKVKIETAVKAAFSDLTRGRKGFQQEQFSKSISESHVERPDDGGSGGILSWR